MTTVIEHKLLEKFPGLVIKDLPYLNPEYSCCICNNTECSNIGKKWHSCCDHTMCSIEEYTRIHGNKV